MLTPQRRFSQRLLYVFLSFSVILIVGTVGYMILEGWDLLDAIYMTVITVSTVGFSEVHPLSRTGQLFTMAVVLAGVSTVAFLFSTMADYIVAGELQGTLQQRWIQGKMEKMQDHYIVCGYGRVGKQVARELEAQGSKVVIIENDPNQMQETATTTRLFVHGDATDDEILRQAGIERARGIVAATGSDAENVFIILSARALNKDLTIVARGIAMDSDRKLRKAGADHVILPHAIGGRRMAGVLLRPTVLDFLDVVMNSEDLQLWLEEIPVEPQAELANCSVDQARVRTRTGANVLAIKTVDGEMLTPVASDYFIEPGDVLVALGTLDQLHQLAQLANHK
ncbi:MAG: potassium channel protein [Chloroflexota bacterium]|nr:potassium channel protein [Chloroflexota bacterium]